MAVVRRVRQHVNPFAIKYQTPVTPPDWSEIFEDPTRPLHLDIGCARGQFLHNFAPIAPDWNFLGIEIREPLVHSALKQLDESGLRNLHFIFCNINNSLAPLLQSLPEGVFQRVSIQFPDPWFKKRHQKRRVTQPALVQQLADSLPSGGIVFLQSDVLDVEQDMCDRFSENPNFQRSSEDWLLENPMPVPTERETVTQDKGEPVYRALYQRL